MRLACAGAGIVAIAHHFSRPSVQAGQLRRILSAWDVPGDVAWAVFPERRLLPAKTRAFIEMLYAALNNLDQ